MGHAQPLEWCIGSWVFQEDESRIRMGHAAYDMSILRCETTAKGGIAANHKQAGWNDGYLLKVLSIGMRLPWHLCTDPWRPRDCRVPSSLSSRVRGTVGNPLPVLDWPPRVLHIGE